MKKFTFIHKALCVLLIAISFLIKVQAQYVSIPVTGFNNDIVANGVGTSTIEGTTYPTIGADGAQYTFIDNTFKYAAASALPTCFMPVSNTAASLRTAGLTYQFEPYTANNALTIDNNSTTYLTSPFANSGTLTLSSPASYGKLFVLYESVMNVSPMTVDVVVTFTDATTQSFPSNACVNWFTTTLPAYSGMGRTTPTGTIQCGTTPNMFELQLSIDPSNTSKLVQSITFTLPASYTTGTTPATVNYFHAMAVGGIVPCIAPIDQPTALSLSSPSGTSVSGSFTAAASAPSGYIAVGYLSGSTPTLPTSGTTYSVGNALGTGQVVAVGSTTSLSVNGLYPGVSYDVYIYSYNSGPCATAYNVNSPLTGTITTSSVGASLLINPYLEGGFENGTTLASNGWNVVNAATNAWTVGTLPTGFTNQSAYISNNGGAAWAFTNNIITASHIYKDISFPAGQSDISLSFNWKALGEASSWDAIIVYTCPTSITPLTSSPTGTANTATWTGGSPTPIGAQLWNQGVNLQTFTACLPASFAGTTQRIVITWKNDGSGGVNPPAGVDNVALVSSTPSAPVDQATSLTLTTISTSQIDGSFTAAASAPTGYIVVRYPTGATPTNPVTGTVYAVGQSLGTGKVAYVGAATSFSATGLSGATTYDFYVYDYKNSTCAGIAYNVTNPLMGTQTTNPCGSMSSPITVGPTGTYATLSGASGAIAAIQASGISAPMLIELQSTYTAAGEIYPITLGFNACVSAVNTLTIQPEAATTLPLIISSANTTATFDLNGASFVTIDGRPGGVGTSKLLSIVNTSATAASAGNAILLRNEANNNTLNYLDIKASNLNPAGNAGTITNGAIPGVVAILSSTGVSGNDNNTVSNCDIHSATSTGNLLNVGVYAYNNTTVGSPANNDNNTINNCSFFDIFHATTATAAIDILVGNNNWTISNNSYYQTASRTYTTAATHRGFWITPGASALGSSGFNITGNYIGGTAANCGGTPYTMLGSIATLFQGMDISVGTLSGSNILNNTIQNIALTTTSTGNYFQGIGIASGFVNIGTSAGTGNTIGSSTGNGSIILTNSTTSSTASIAAGIRVGGGALISINYNTIGSITINNGAISNTFVGINVVGGGTTSATITNNLIGSLSTSNSIQTTGGGAAATGMGMCGIFVSSGPATSTVSNNTIANLNSAYTGTTATTVFGLRGIDVAVGSNTISGNTIRNLTSNSASVGSGNSSAICGIIMRSTTAPTNISENTIHSLKLNNASTTAALQITGLFVSCAATGSNLITKNNIHSLSLTPANNAVTITGLTVSAGAATYSNNMIRLGYDDLGNSISAGIQLRGITKGVAVANKFYHNSIYIGGTGVATSTLNSFAFQRSTAPTALPNDEVLNNIFVNERSNASTGGKHYVFSASANTFLNANVNDYYVTGVGGVFGLNLAADVATYAPGWIASDVSSFNSDPLFINPTGDAILGDLHINPTLQTAIEQGGTFVSGVLDDFDNQTRSTLSPIDIGADAGNFVPLNPCTGAPLPGNTLSSASMVCPGSPFTLSLQNSIIAPGLSFQWYNNNGLIVGATNSSYTTSILAADDFYCEVTCFNGGSPITSASNLITINLNPFLYCYCTSGLGGSCTINSMTSVSIAGTTFNNVTGCTGTYSQFPPTPTTTATLIPGATNTMTVGCIAGSNTQAAIWIDYNQDGTFSPSEYTLINGNITSGSTGSGTFIIPITALSGTTGMRVRSDWQGTTAWTSADACTLRTWGETEDYVITIAPLPMDPPNPIQVNTPNCALGGELAAVGSAPPGETWYWQTSASGTSTAFSAFSNYNIMANGTYYLRSQSNAYFIWSTGAGSITVTNFPVGPADPSAITPSGNPACGTVTLVSTSALSGTTNYWQETNALGTSTSLMADDGSTNTPYIVPATGTYYLRARDNASFCWSNNVGTVATVLQVPTAPILAATPASICPGGNSALTAIAPSAPPTGYTLGAIPYAYEIPTGTVSVLANAGAAVTPQTLSSLDDGTWTNLALPFPINFYGTNYTTFNVSTNGFMTLGAALTGAFCCSGQTIPSAAAPNAYLAIAHEDWLLTASGTIDYFTNGTAPNRLFVLRFTAVPRFGGTGAPTTGEIIFHEATGYIDYQITSVTTASGDITTMGIEDPTGTNAVVVAGRNATSPWTATNEGWRFSPIQPMNFLWTPNGVGSGIAVGNETLANTIASPSATTTYTMTITDPLNGCSNSNILIVNALANPPAPSATGGSTPCGVGSATLNAIGTGGTLNWYAGPIGGPIIGTGGTFTTPSIAANTTYYVEETNGTCSSSRTSAVATFTPSDPISASSNVSFVCVGGANSANLSATSTNANYSYTWEPGSLSGANVTVTPTVNTTYTVTGVDGLCINTSTVTVNATVIAAPVLTATPANICLGGNTILNAFAPSAPPSGYTLSTIPYNYEVPTGTVSVLVNGGVAVVPQTIASLDDGTWTNLSLPFAFNYFGTVYNNFNVSTNGFITLGTTLTTAACCSGQVIPNAAVPNAYIALAHEDWNLGVSGTIDYFTNGVAPNRKFVIRFTAVPRFGGTGAPTTGEIILNELDGSIDLQVNSVTTAAADLTTMGIENPAGTTALVVAGRNSTAPWTATNEGWRFLPIQPMSFSWTPNGPGSGIAVGNETLANISASPSATTTYTMTITEPLYGCSLNSTITVGVNLPSASTTVYSTCVTPYVWNGNSYTTTGIYSYTTMNAAGCDSVATLDLTITPCNTTLNLTCYIQGYWDGTSQMQPVLFNQGEPTTTGACDSIIVELHSDTAPYGIDATTTAVLQQNGTATCIFPPVTGNKYIAVKHRSAVQTWSAAPVTMGTIVSYNFSTAANMAYGDNQIEVSTSPSIWAFYSGDIIIDENIDLLDLGNLETEISNFSFGYVAADINGDGNVDLLDSPIMEVNISNFIFSNHP